MRIYFLGVGGTAMGNAALLLRDLGHEVSGSDQAVYPPMSDLLAEAGVEILEGYSAERLRELNPDLVVVGNAFSRGNEEVESLLSERSIPFASLPEALSRFVLMGRRSIVVAGTHGKTTTTSLAAYLLEQAGANPGYLIGGAPLDPEKGWRNGDPDSPFVIEGDEYDSAFFDKRSKFIHYAPHIAIVNNLEFDHADIFRDLDDVKRSFEHLTRIVPGNGYLLANGDDANVESLLPISWTRTVRVGTGANCDLRIENYETTDWGSSFELVWKGSPWLSVNWRMAGLFNARNAAMACLAAALAIVGEDDVCSFTAEGLDAFRGVKRRQQIRYSSDALVVVEDFAHHPTAIGEILRTLKEQYPDRSLIAAFEPRSNTSRLDSMREPMRVALARADAVVIGAPKQSSDSEIMDTKALAESLSESGVPAASRESNAESLELLQERLGRTDGKALVAFLTNGSFDGIIDAFVAAR